MLTPATSLSMEPSRYFERTLSYDCSPAANDHYELCSEQVFESDLVKTEVTVCVQSHQVFDCGSIKAKSDQRKRGKDSSDSGTNLVVYDRDKSSSDEEGDSCSVVSSASSTALPAAMDQRQEDSGPPSYPGPPKLAFFTIKHGDIESFARRTRHDFRVFYLHHRTHSFSRLRISKPGFETLMRSCRVFPRFNEYVAGFGRKNSDSEIGPPPLKFRPLYTTSESGYRAFECAYVLRFVERTERGGRKRPWSLRQYAVYHRFKPGQQGSSTWILVGASQRTRGHLDQYTRSVDDIKTANPFELHAIFLDTVIASWRPYLVYITQLVASLSSKATGVCISTEDDEENFVTITVEDHQQLKQIEDDVTDLILCLDSTSDTLTTFEEMYERFRYGFDEASSILALDAIAVSLAEKTKEIRYTKRKAEALQSKVQNTRALISSLLERQSGHNINNQIGALHEGNSIMQTIAEKNSRDSSSMRVLTIITMVYLPCTIVSNFYSTQFVLQVEGDGTSTKMGYAQNAWLFFAISVPLTVFTFLVWYAWVRMADMRNLVAVPLSTKKKAESPV